MVVLHGGPGASHDYLRPGFDLLAAGRTLIYYDQRGGGQSPVPAGTPVGWREQVADLDALREAWGLDQLTICGYSWGGLLAMLYATEHPDRVARLALVSPAPAWRAARHGVRADLLRPQHEPGTPGGASGAARQRPSRARPRCLPAAPVRALGGAVLRRSHPGAAAHRIPHHRADAAGSLVEPRRLRPSAAGSRSSRCRRSCCTARRT